MIAFFIDFVTVAALIIGITALIGVITNSIGEKLFGGKEKMKFVNKKFGCTIRLEPSWWERYL